MLTDFRRALDKSNFTGMRNKNNLHILLICVSLLGILVFQAILIQGDYLDKRAEFRQDVNQFFTESLDSAKAERSSRLNQMYIDDLRDTSIVKIEYDLNDEAPSLSIYNVVEQNYEASISTERASLPIDSLTEEALFNHYFLNNTNQDNHYWLLHSIMHNRFDIYRDTVSIDQDYLKNTLKRKLDEAFIDVDFELLITTDEGIVDSSLKEMITMPKELIGGAENDYIYAVFQNPFFEVLKRSLALLIGAFLLFLMVLFSFLLLVRSLYTQRKLSKLKDDFIDSVTHELLTPIATLKLALESERQRNKNDESKYLKIADQELKRITDITHNVLNSGLHKHVKAEVPKQMVEVVSVINEVLTYNKLVSSIPFETSFSGDQKVNVVTNEELLKTVLNNLIDNAIKYCDKGQACLAVDIKKSMSELVIRIEDNGRGIPPEHQEAIFNKFYRAPLLAHESIKGLGVGLFVSRSIMESLGGSLGLISSSINGSVFEIKLNLGDEN
ncbi:phospho-acceptor domain-containing protein [Roseivirga pacifica]|uniref:histidine kinase n=2 Tax=Roseivirga pacifica TaxID=1267423 RepID=A0A1I0QST2_9BACT|nr:phospho-acceptor domain-containing protein [Roseivirga pacifica]SEW30451.1 His Kinase A (phospho-acceptor) domain-containing protein [Roseivirga pacifica]